MTPDPYLRGQLVALAALIVACAALNSWIATLIITGLTAGAGAALERRYRRDVAAPNAFIPGHRDPLDRMLVREALIALAVVGLAVGAQIAVSPSFLDEAWPFRPALVALTAAAAAIYASSLVDWYVILPRIGGQLGPRPCRKPEPDFKHRPRTWRETTRWWYVHRCSATVIVRVALSVALANIIGETAGLDLAGRILIAAATGIFSVYFFALRWAIPEAMQARAIVGQTVRVGKIRPPKWRLPWSSWSAPSFRGRYYVVDVDVGSVQLIDVRDYEATLGEAESRPFARHPENLSLRHLGAVTRARQPFAGCQADCGRINWYCVENPQCYEAK